MAYPPRKLTTKRKFSNPLYEGHIHINNHVLCLFMSWKMFKWVIPKTRNLRFQQLKQEILNSYSYCPSPPTAKRLLKKLMPHYALKSAVQIFKWVTLNSSRHLENYPSNLQQLVFAFLQLKYEILNPCSYCPMPITTNNQKTT